jgi:hypothetical protein
VIRRSSRKRKTEGDVNSVAERRDLDRCHPDVVVRRDHRIELAAHRAHEHRVGGERSADAGFARRGREKVHVIAAESPAVTRMRIERAERDSRLVDAEPLPQSGARDACRFSYRFRAQLLAHLSERNVGGRQHDAELLGGEHHRHA